MGRNAAVVHPGTSRSVGFFLVLICFCGALAITWAAPDPLGWPEPGPAAKPRAYWWWMASAVDTNNLARELTRYRDAGMGGVHIIPIYGAKGWESNYISYLSPQWMEMLDFTVREARRLGLEVDMTTGSGWCFGGPRVTDQEANAAMISREWHLGAGERFSEKVEPANTQALMAFGPNGGKVDLHGRIQGDGRVDWTAADGPWTVYAVSQKPSGQKVKRAAPGGAGHMLNLFYPSAMTNYLRWMDEAFASYRGARPRAQYHDSYEYRSDWAPDFFAQFERRRGYRLQDEWDVFISGRPAERAARLKCDYRETLSQVMAEETLPLWNQWTHRQGCLTRNEAHGSPGNWLDLYATSDIPETEMFYLDRNRLISKFASSAAHVAGKPLVGSETGTWLKEHFTETLADMKFLLDDLFLSGVNHVFYHGTCYSPDEAAWPGWLFYASYEMNPRNSIWRDVPALNAYATRCQSVLQSGRPDNDFLVYWPIHDLWTRPDGMARNLTVHARDWFEEQPFGKVAEQMWRLGYQFDYISDQQLEGATTVSGGIQVKGGTYRAIVIPPCEHIPVATLAKLLQLAKGRAGTVLFVDRLPVDVPGLSRLESRREEFAGLLKQIQLKEEAAEVKTANLGKRSGLLAVGPLEAVLKRSGIPREPMLDLPGLMCIRRGLPDGRYYFVANRGSAAIDTWVPLGTPAKSVGLLDPLSGQVGMVAARPAREGRMEVPLRLLPGGSVILRTFTARKASAPRLPEPRPSSESVTLTGSWQVRFLSGGPVLPAPFVTEKLASWTGSGDTNAQSFAGTALYALRFDLPPGLQNGAGARTFQLDLGQVCQSARVRLNDVDCGTVFTAPYRLTMEHLKARDNLLEVEVTNTSANRIRDLDRRGVKWQNFYDINFVNLSYKPFNAADWPVADAGLLGPVTLTPTACQSSPDNRAQ